MLIEDKKGWRHFIELRIELGLGEADYYLVILALNSLMKILVNILPEEIQNQLRIDFLGSLNCF